MVRSFRSRPVGWRYDSVRHSLAAKGYCTRRADARWMARKDGGLPEEAQIMSDARETLARNEAAHVSANIRMKELDAEIKDPTVPPSLKVLAKQELEEYREDVKEMDEKAHLMRGLLRSRGERVEKYFVKRGFIDPGMSRRGHIPPPQQATVNDPVPPPIEQEGADLLELGVLDRKVAAGENAIPMPEPVKRRWWQL